MNLEGFAGDLRPVGVVRSETRERKAMPAFGSPATVEIFPEYAPALHRIERHTHLWVLAWLDFNAERDLLQVKPRGRRHEGDEALHGVFALRSPARPNPIGLTAARVLGHDGLTIALDYLDFLDGTPVLDLKPYYAPRDMIFSAANPQMGRPMDREASLQFLRMTAIQFHGASTPDLERAVAIWDQFRRDVLDHRDPQGLTISVPLARPAMADAFMGMTRVSPGRGTLRFSSEDTVEIHHAAGAWRYPAVEESANS
ncbi:MAG: tRNA (N6-threonylcarbamoyladenosine(37)-N6)-methyltransferase TrmO [Acidobacteria bacterium]|nr:tRNA (N6-threonylcarbamoyladenosine(37)-N6)-methyltransferase TrmO [Acidobacteriota bacterium]